MIQHIPTVIARVTSRCNFDCTFCSATNLPDKCEMTVDQLINYCEQWTPTTVCLEGGDPLMWGVDNIRTFIDYANTRSFIKDVGITSNLWDFYKRPQKWVDIFKSPKVDVCTSFQYGNARRISKDRVFNEQTFIEIYDLYHDLVNKPLSFIYVIDEHNEMFVDKAIELAKRLNTVCKINGKFVSGRSTTNYRLDKLYKIYERIITNGDSEYEDNCFDIVRLAKHQHITSCCLATDCANKFRIVDGSGFVSTCSIGSNNAVIRTPFKLHDITKSTGIVKSECLTCPCYQICNNCKVTCNSLKNLPNDQLQTVCSNLKASYNNIVQYVKSH